jgi:hypothetical protein
MGSHWVFIIQCNDSKNYDAVSYVKIGCVFNDVGNCSWLLYVLITTACYAHITRYHYDYRSCVSRVNNPEIRYIQFITDIRPSHVDYDTSVPGNR